MLYLVGIIITFFLAILLLSKKGKTVADGVLAIWLCVIGLHLFLFYVFITGSIYNYSYLLGIGIPMPLLHGPFLHIYTLTVTRYNKFSNYYWLHFLPAAIAYLLISRFFLLSAAERIGVYKNGGAGFETETGIIFIAIIISGFAYVILSFRELHRYKKRISDEFSNTEKINLNWLRYLMFGILAIWLVVALNGEDAVIFAAAVLFVLLLGYFGINQVGIFTYRRALIRETLPAIEQEIKLSPISDQKIYPANETSVTGEKTPVVEKIILEKVEGGPGLIPRYEKSSLQKAAADKIHTDLSALIEKEKIFKDAELSLAALAQRLQVHPNNLSQVINSYEHKNFYDYINIRRIEEFKTLVILPENQQYTLLSLAFECGFNSKTSFNRNFKKITGQSPSDYLKEVNIQLD